MKTITNYIKTIMVVVLVSITVTITTTKTNNFLIKTVQSTDTIRGQEYKVTATMYYAVQGQCDKDPLTTAGMYQIDPKRASEHKWIAMSRDMIARWNGEFNYGDLVEIRGAGHKDGVYKVVDTMNKRFTNRIDFLETKGTKPYKFENVTLTKITWNSKTEKLLASL